MVHSYWRYLRIRSWLALEDTVLTLVNIQDEQGEKIKAQGEKIEAVIAVQDAPQGEDIDKQVAWKYRSPA